MHSGGELAEDGRAEWHAAVAGGGISDGCACGVSREPGQWGLLGAAVGPHDRGKCTLLIMSLFL